MSDILHPNILTTAEEAARFTLAGDAYVTLKSITSGTHYTYHVASAEDRDNRPPLWFVSLRTGGDDTFSYAGVMEPTIDRTAYKFRLTKKSRMGLDAPGVKAWVWFVGHVLNRHTMPPQLEVWHEGKCGKCARTLTHPASIELGIGPVCARKMGLSCDVPEGVGE